MTVEEIEQLVPGDHVEAQGKEYELLKAPVRMEYDSQKNTKDEWYKLEVVCGNGHETEIGVADMDTIRRMG